MRDSVPMCHRSLPCTLKFCQRILHSRGTYSKTSVRMLHHLSLTISFSIPDTFILSSQFKTPWGSRRMQPVSRNIFLPICSPPLPCFHIFSAKDEQKYPDIITNDLPYLRTPHAPYCSRQLGEPHADPFIPPQNQTIHCSDKPKARNHRQDSSRHYRTHKWQHQQIQQHRIDRDLIEKP